jgi:hypothetical protein
MLKANGVCVSSALGTVLGITEWRNAVSGCAGASAVVSSKGRLEAGLRAGGAVDVRGLMGVVRLMEGGSYWVVLLNQVGVVFRSRSGIPQPDQDLQYSSKTSRT